MASTAPLESLDPSFSGYGASLVSRWYGFAKALVWPRQPLGFLPSSLPRYSVCILVLADPPGIDRHAAILKWTACLWLSIVSGG